MRCGMDGGAGTSAGRRHQLAAVRLQGGRARLAWPTCMVAVWDRRGLRPVAGRTGSKPVPLRVLQQTPSGRLPAACRAAAGWTGALPGRRRRSRRCSLEQLLLLRVAGCSRDVTRGVCWREGGRGRGGSGAAAAPRALRRRRWRDNRVIRLSICAAVAQDTGMSISGVRRSMQMWRVHGRETETRWTFLWVKPAVTEARRVWGPDLRRARWRCPPQSWQCPGIRRALPPVPRSSSLNAGILLFSRQAPICNKHLFKGQRAKIRV